MRTTRRSRRHQAPAPRAGHPLSPRAGERTLPLPAGTPGSAELPSAVQVADAAALREFAAGYERLRASEERARDRVDALERRARLLACVDEILDAAPEAVAEETAPLLARVAACLLSTVAEFVRVDLVAEDGSLQAAVAAHAPERRSWLPDGAPALAACAVSGCVVVEDGLACVPMAARGRMLGVLALGRARNEEAVEVAAEVARRVAVALDNARRIVRAREAACRREQALAAVSHELRGPLQVISLASGALLRAWPADPALLPERRQVSIIAQSAERMRRLACDLVDAARLDAEGGRFPVCPAAVDAGAMLHAAAGLYRPLAEQKGVMLEVASAPAVPVLGDEGRVQQVLANLIDNAVRHTPRGGAVTLSAEVGEGEARFAVTDTGAGIAPEHLPRVFERYWRGERGRGGAGLGLAISRAIVQSHGGTLRVHSLPGHGATFVFTLPLVPA